MAPTAKSKRTRKAADAQQAAEAEEDVGSPKDVVKPNKRSKKDALALANGVTAKVDDKAGHDEAGSGPSEDDGPQKKKRAPAKPKPPVGPLYDAATMRPPRYEGSAHRLLAWNVAGLRALLKKDGQALSRLVAQEQVDVLCLQETKLQGSHCEDVAAAAGLDGWHMHWNCSNEKKGYSGVATLCRDKPLSVVNGMGRKEHDDEGRVLTVELPDLYVVNIYTPNSGEGLRRLDYRISPSGWDACFAAFVASLAAKGKPVVVAGDLNCAHKDIDIHEPRRNLKSAGFTPEERASFSRRILVAEPAPPPLAEGEEGPKLGKAEANMQKIVAEGAARVEGLLAPDEVNAGLVDAFRAKHPGVVAYTYYSHRFKARETNKGWRLDYCLVSQSAMDRVYDAYILSNITGSDHVPHGLVLKRD